MTSAIMGRVFFLVGAMLTTQLFKLGGGTIKPPSNSDDHHLKAPPADDATALLMEPLEQDLVTDLPGLEYDPGFKQYAGYLTIDEGHGRNIFYWYMESKSSPSTDPLVLWTNGGPGCSGLVGMGTEHGPYYISKAGTLSPNPYSWNTVANVLYIEQPSGVGFSYSDTHADYHTGDDKAAHDNYKLIRQFLKRFPERQTNEFYIASESYGGHYMPQCE
jgi:carboxypeptidase C (cathepsin A)